MNKHTLHLINRILLDCWDPVGVNGIDQAADEYESYVPEVYSRLADGRDGLKNFLLDIEINLMGLSGDSERAERVAQKLLLVKF